MFILTVETILFFLSLETYHILLFSPPDSRGSYSADSQGRRRKEIRKLDKGGLVKGIQRRTFVYSRYLCIIRGTLIFWQKIVFRSFEVKGKNPSYLWPKCSLFKAAGFWKKDANFTSRNLQKRLTEYFAGLRSMIDEIIYSSETLVVGFWTSKV